MATVTSTSAEAQHLLGLAWTSERQANGAEVVQGLIEQSYGVRDCAFRDPAGNLIRISERR